MKQRIREIGPDFDTSNKVSELDILNEIGSFKEHLAKLQFNFNFDRDSYDMYSKLQNVIRIELTEFR